MPGHPPAALEALRRNEPVFGLTLTYPQPAIAEAALWSGFDFLIVDAEHGVADEAAQLDVLRTAAGGHAFALVRVRPGDDGAVVRYLDFGADGILVPDVRSVEQARHIGFTARARWTGGVRSDRYASATSRKPVPALVVILIESAEGVRCLDDILDVEGIDGVIVGAGDLSIDLGVAGQFGSAAYRSAVAKVEEAAKARGKILGGRPEPSVPLADFIARGYRLITAVRDMPLIARAFSHSVEALREEARREGITP